MMTPLERQTRLRRVSLLSGQPQTDMTEDKHTDTKDVNSLQTEIIDRIQEFFWIKAETDVCRNKRNHLAVMCKQQ